MGAAPGSRIAANPGATDVSSERRLSLNQLPHNRQTKIVSDPRQVGEVTLMRVDQLISAVNRTDHLPHSPVWNAPGREWTTTVAGLLHEHQAHTVLNYGCGEASVSLAIALRERGLDLIEYDPATVGKDSMPPPADFVICTNVLEHLETARIWACLEHVAAITKRVAFVLVSVGASGHEPSDGRPGNMLVRSVTWWRIQLQAHDFVIWDEPHVRSDSTWVAVLRKKTTC